MAFSQNVIFTNGKCMLFPECCPRVSLRFLPWESLFPDRQDMSSVCRSSCGNSLFSFFLCLLLAGRRRRLELGCKTSMASQHCTLLLWGGSKCSSTVVEGEGSC